MKYQKVTDENIINKLYQPGKVQAVVMAFHEDTDCKVAKVDIYPGEYKNGSKTAQNSYKQAIDRLGFNMKARLLDKELYLIKLD